MIVLTPRFATLLLLVATVHAAFVPQRPDSQAPFHAHSTSEDASSLYNTYSQALNPFRNPFFLRRSVPATHVTKSSGKKAGAKEAKATSTTAPVPDSAKPASERSSSNANKVNHKASDPENFAAASGHGKHSPGEHHRDNKSKSRKAGKSKGHKKNKVKRGLVAEEDLLYFHRPRSNSRLFKRVRDLPEWHAKKDVIVVDEHGHDHDHRGHDYHDHDHRHDHRDLGLVIDGVLDPLLKSRSPVHSREPHSHDGSEGQRYGVPLLELDLKRGNDEQRRHQAREPEDLIEVNVEAEMRLKRDHDHDHDHDHHHHHHDHHHHDKKAVIVERGHLVIYDIGHGHDRAYHVHDKRDHRHIADHINIHEHIHEHKQHKRDAPSGVPGSIQIVSPMEAGKSPVKIANLVLASVDNSTGSAPPNASFVLNASNETETQVYLVTNDSSDSPIIPVALQVPMYDAEQVKVVPHCVTYNPKATEPGPLSVCSCGQSSEHVSQMFEFTRATGNVRPMWTSSQDAGVENAEQPSFDRMPIANEVTTANFADASDATTSNSTSNSTAPAPPTNSTSTTSSASSTPASNDTSTPASNTTSSPSTASATPQSVALIFKPANAEAADSDDDSSTQSAAPSTTSNWTDSSSTMTPTDGASSSTASSTTNTSTSTPSTAFDAAWTSTDSSTASSSTLTSTITSTAASSTSIADPDNTSSDTSQAQSTARAIDAAAPYEWMFTPKGTRSVRGAPV